MEESTAKSSSQTTRLLQLLLKVGITILCFWYISKKIDFGAAKTALLKANWWWLLLALLLLSFSKLLSSFRLNIYFSNIQIHLPEWKNIKLYWLGMFYNLFLPGSISGDAYKVILLKRKYDAPYKQTSAAVLLDRFSGLLALCIIMSFYGIIVFKEPFFDILLIGGSVIAVFSLYFIIKKIFPYFKPGFWPTFFWGLGVQLSQVICVYCILLSLHIPITETAWIFIFLVAAVVAVLPLSLGGGLGTREVVFVEGAKYFHLDPQSGLIISLLFYLLTVLSSLPGLFFVFNDPLKDRA